MILKQMHLYTVVNKEDPGLDLWRLTAEKFHYNAKVLYAPKTSKLGHSTGGWFGQKFVTLAEELKQLDPNTLCLVTDGFDVIFIQDSIKVEDKIKRAIDVNSQLLFAAEVYENPDQGNPYVIEGRFFPYLNSGVYAGKASIILKALDTVLHSEKVLELDDQRFFTQYMFQHPDQIVLDYDAKVFACLAGYDGFRIEKNTFLIPETNGEPGILHFQGYFKNTLGVIPYLFPSDERMIHLASLLHRVKNIWTPLGDALVKIGKLFPLGNRNPFLVGLVVVLLLLFSFLLQLYLGNKNVNRCRSL
jgi:hypothetical protein